MQFLRLNKPGEKAIAKAIVLEPPLWCHTPLEVQSFFYIGLMYFYPQFFTMQNAAV